MVWSNYRYSLVHDLWWAAWPGLCSTYVQIRWLCPPHDPQGEQMSESYMIHTGGKYTYFLDVLYLPSVEHKNSPGNYVLNDTFSVHPMFDYCSQSSDNTLHINTFILAQAHWRQYTWNVTRSYFIIPVQQSFQMDLSAPTVWGTTRGNLLSG